MLIIRPIEIPPYETTSQEAVLTSSTVPEAASGEDEYDSTVTYNTGDIVTVLGNFQRRYKSLIDSNTDNFPPDSINEWADLGFTNRWKMFDGGTGTLTSQSDSIKVVLQPGGLVNALSFFNLDASGIDIKVEDSTGVVFNKSASFPLETSSSNWYSYFFETFGEQFRDSVVLDIPPVSDPKITVTISRPESIAACGLLLIGRQQPLGITNYGSSVSIRDFSVKQTDEFGNPTVVERTFVKRAELDIILNTSDVSRVQRTLAERRAEATVYVGSQDAALFSSDPIHEETLVYGYYVDFDIVLSDKNTSRATLEVEGL
jgi:hypothetical protein